MAYSDFVSVPCAVQMQPAAGQPDALPPGLMPDHLRVLHAQTAGENDADTPFRTTPPAQTKL